MKFLINTKLFRLSLKRWSEPYVPKTRFILNKRALFVRVGRDSMIASIGEFK